MYHIRICYLLPGCTLLACLMLMSGCGGSDSNSPATNSGGGSTVNADGTTNLAQHRQTIYNIQNESHKLFVIIAEGGLSPAPTATTDQQETFKEVASPHTFGEAKGAVLTYADWMDNLDANQLKELNAKLDALQGWIDDMKACYPFAAGSQLPQAKTHVDKLDGYVKAIKADLPD